MAVGQEDLESIAVGLEELRKKFKRNEKEGDSLRLERTLQALNALRKVILNVAVKGAIVSISPLMQEENFVWEVVESDQTVKLYKGSKDEKESKNRFV